MCRLALVGDPPDCDLMFMMVVDGSIALVVGLEVLTNSLFCVTKPNA